MASTASKAEHLVGSRIPTFDTIDEEAEFWETHSFTEFDDELDDVPDRKLIGLWTDGTLNLWLEPEAVAALTRQAEEQGTGPALLARAWILERLGIAVEPR